MPCAMRSAPSQRERTGLGINTSRSPARRKPSSNSSHTLLTSLPVASSPRTGSTGSLAKATTSATTTSPVRIQRSEEHTSELQSLAYLVCRLLLEKKKKKKKLNADPQQEA